MRDWREEEEEEREAAMAALKATTTTLFAARPLRPLTTKLRGGRGATRTTTTTTTTTSAKATTKANAQAVSLTCSPIGSFGFPFSKLRRNFRGVVLSASGEDTEAPAVVDERQDLVNSLDIRVGKILSVKEHEEADSLFIEAIDVGDEDGPRTIVSGLRPYMPASELEGKDCVVLCNLKPRNMRGVKSHGMLLCASDKKGEEDDVVELLSPPEGSPVGERLCFGGFTGDLPDPFGPNKIQKKKIWEKVQPDLKTDAQGGAQFQDLPMVASTGQIKSKSLTNSNIS